MDTITRLMNIFTQQNGYILSAADALAVSRLCYGIAAVFCIIAFVIRIKIHRKQIE